MTNYTDYIKYMDTVNYEARCIWREVFTSSRDNSTEETLEYAIKLANKATDAYLKKCTKLATNDWIAKVE